VEERLVVQRNTQIYLLFQGERLERINKKYKKTFSKNTQALSGCF
jgi:Mor family transcriptional regulator